MSKEYKFHEASDIFPLDEENLDELAEDIIKHGQQVAIEILDGEIIDGRRRYLACKRAKVEPRVIEVNVDIDDLVDYVVSLNLHRRHLTPSQRATSAAKATKLKEKYAREAKGRQVATLMRGKERPVVENLPPRSDAGKTRDKMGKVFGVSGRMVTSAEKVLRKGTPALKDAVDTKLMAISTAEKISSLPEEDQDVLVEQVKKARAEGKNSKVRTELDHRRYKNDDSTDGLKGKGIIYAQEAINWLRRIPKDDALRARGFQSVTDWIRHNK